MIKSSSREWVPQPNADTLPNEWREQLPMPAGERRRLHSRQTDSSQDTESPGCYQDSLPDQACEATADRPANVRHYKLVTHKIASRGSPNHRFSDSFEPRASEGHVAHRGESIGGEDDSLHG